MIKRGKIILTVLILLIIFFSINVFAGDLFSLQGNVDDSSGQKLSSGGVVVEVWDGPDVAGSNLVYNSTDNFTGSANISNGKFDIILGNALDQGQLNLEYGRVYYMDMFVAGENMNFSGAERQPFMSSVGTINSSFLNVSNDYTVGSLTVNNITAATLLLNVSHGTDMIIVNSTGINFGSGLLYVDPITNRVGIGTTTPLYAFDVQNFAVFTNLAHFSANVSMADNLTVGGNALYVDSSSGSVGIGTTVPAYLLQVEGTTNTTGLRTEGLSHFLSNVTIDDNLTVGGNTLYVDSSAGRVGIGTSSPGATLEVINTTAITNILNVSHGDDMLVVNATGVDLDSSTLFVDSVNNRVGIGTTAPGESLHIYRSGNNNAILMIEAQGVGASYSPVIIWKRSTNAADEKVYDAIMSGSTPGLWEWRAVNDAQTAANNFMEVRRTGYVPTSVAFPSGSVGIGTTTPGSKLEVVGNVNLTNGSLYAVQNDGNNETVTEMLTLEHLNASGDVGSGIGSGIVFRAPDDAGESENISMIAGVMSNVSNGSERGDIVFYTGYGDGDGLISNLSSSEKMRITGAGSVGIGTSSPGAKLEVVNDSAYEGLLLNVTNGATDFVYNATTGNVGIGTAAPGYKFHVLAPSAGGIVARFEDTATDSNPAVSIKNDAQSWLMQTVGARSDNFEIWDNTGSAGAVLAIKSNGNVGIGTTTPGATLEVVNASAVTNILNVSHGDDMLVVNATGVDLDSSTLFVDSVNNRVGIGTARPLYKFQVRTGTNENFMVRSSTEPTGGIFLQSVNDADTVSGPMQFGASLYNFVTGNVGIGTSSPASLLEIKSTGSPLLYLNVSDSNTGTVTDMLTLEHVNASGQATDGIGSGILFRSIDDGMDVENISMIAGVMEDTSNASERGALVFYTGYGDGDGLISNLSSSEAMRITGDNKVIINGSVGIGTSSPGATLEVIGELNVSNGTDVGMYFNKTSGYVGIGTTAPSANLDVRGGTMALGAALPSRSQFFIGGTFTPGGTEARGGLDIRPTVTVQANADASSIIIIPTFNKAGSGTHAMFASVHLLAPTIGAGAATLTNAATLYLDTTPSGATNNYALLIDEGTVSLGTGNVGIGTTTPSMLLDVNGDANLTGTTYIGNSTLYVNGSNVGIGTVTPGTTLEIIGDLNVTGASYLGNMTFTDNATFIDSINVSEDLEAGGVLFVDGRNGNVGIGTTGPAATIDPTISSLLEIGGAIPGITFDSTNSAQESQFGTDGAGLTIKIADHATGANNFISLWTEETNSQSTPTERMRILSTGSVGIGTTTPANKLEIAGDLNVTQGNTTLYGGLEVVNSSDTANSYLFVDNETGNVGIGTAGPAAKLHILNTNASATVTGLLLHNQGSSANTAISMDFAPHEAAAPLVLARITAFREADANAPTSLRFFTYDDGGSPTGLNERMRITSTGRVGIGTSTPSGLLHLQNDSSAVTNAYLNISDGPNQWLTVDSAGKVVIGDYNYPGNSTALLTISGGDLNVSGSIYYGGASVQGSPMVLQSAEGEPIPICMKNSEGNWVGCMPDANNNWKCEHNEECDKKVLRVETERKLKSEGVDDEEVSRKVEMIREKFEQGKNLQAIKEEVRAEIGDMSVLNELDDSKPKFSIQSSSSEVSALVGEVNGLKSENDLLKSELCKKDNTYSWCVVEGQIVEEPAQEPQQETPLQETPVEQTPQEPAANNAPVIESFMPETVPVMSIGDSQEFTVTASDADNDVLSLQWYVNSLAVDGQVSDSFTYTASAAGEFQVKVLVSDSKDYVTKEWTLTVGQQGKSYGITGAATGVINRGRNSLLSWLRSRF